MMPFTDNDLRAARARMLARSADLRDRIGRVRADLGRARDTVPRGSTDAAIVVENDEVLHAIESAASDELRRIDFAIARLDAGTFGSCEKCGGKIETARLEIVPHATQCGQCESGAR